MIKKIPKSHLFPPECIVLGVNVDNFITILLEEINTIKATKYPFKVTFSPEITTKGKLQEFYHKPEIYIGKLCNDVFSNIYDKI